MNIIETYGHSVIIPIYFFSASEDFFVNIYDSILRRECKIDFQKYIDVNYITAIDYNKDYTSQKIFTSIAPIIPQAKFGTIYTQINFPWDKNIKLFLILHLYLMMRHGKKA